MMPFIAPLGRSQAKYDEIGMCIDAEHGYDDASEIDVLNREIA